MDLEQVTPRFSFLTTAYGTELVLAETIDSVVGQTRPDWELVVVDNGQSDELAAVVEAYLADPRITLVRQPNRGYAGGVMAAAAVARGDFLCVLDSDDLLLPDFAAVIGRVLDSHPEVDAVGCDAKRFLDGDGALVHLGYFESIGHSPPPRGGARLSAEDVLDGMVPYYTGAIRRQAWDAIGGYRVDAPDVEPDVTAWIRLAADHHVHVLPDRLARCRVRDDSLSRSAESIDRFEERLISSFDTVTRMPSSAEARVAAVRTVRRLRYHQALRRARRALLDGDVATARHWAGQAWAQRRTGRSAVVVLVLRVSPGLLVRIHPLKGLVADAIGRARAHLGSPDP